jgi:hypothetical protein
MDCPILVVVLCWFLFDVTVATTACTLGLFLGRHQAPTRMPRNPQVADGWVGGLSQSVAVSHRWCVTTIYTTTRQPPTY